MFPSQSLFAYTKHFQSERLTMLIIAQSDMLFGLEHTSFTHCLYSSLALFRVNEANNDDDDEI